MSEPSASFGTITAFHGSHKIGLDVTDQPVVKPVQKCAVTKWLVQSVDNEEDYYRLFVGDSEKSYALCVSEKGTGIHAFGAIPSCLKSHVWFIPHLAGEFFGILDPVTIRAWKVNGTTIELVDPSVADDALESFKFKFPSTG